MFWPIFGPFSLFLGAKTIFLENPVLSRTTSYGFLATSQNLEKINDTTQRKWPDRWRTDPFYRTLLATAGSPISHFKRKLHHYWSNGIVVRALDSQSRDPRFKTTGGSKVDSAFQPSEVDQMSTRTSCPGELVVKSKVLKFFSPWVPCT